METSTAARVSKIKVRVEYSIELLIIDIILRRRIKPKVITSNEARYRGIIFLLNTTPIKPIINIKIARTNQDPVNLE
jgi:hypothetical protein